MKTVRSDSTTRIELPGPWINHSDRDWAFLARMLLAEIIEQLDEAGLALRLFETDGAGASGLRDHPRRLQFLSAKSFVYALDAVNQLIRVLKKQEALPLEARDYCSEYLSRFGDLRLLRNSLQHIEDRLRGIGQNGTPIPSPLLVMGALRDGSFFGATTSEGRYVEVEVSSSVLDEAYKITEDLLWSFDSARSATSY